MRPPQAPSIPQFDGFAHGFLYIHRHTYGITPIVNNLDKHFPPFPLLLLSPGAELRIVRVHVRRSAPASRERSVCGNVFIERWAPGVPAQAEQRKGG